MRLYRYLNALSIDVVVGTVISSLFFAKLFYADLPMVVLVALALAVWSIYSIDHLWDAQRSPKPSLTFRHHFHLKHSRLLTALLTAALLAGGILFWYLPENIRKMGFVLAFTILIYFLVTSLWGDKPVYHKELLIAVAYSCGVILAPYCLRQTQITTFHLLVFSQFAALAFSNLLIFSYFDTELDSKQHFGSLSRSIGKRNTRLLIILILSLVMVTSVVGLIQWSDDPLIRQSQWIMALMTVPLAVILTWQTYYNQYDRYRILGDITFFIPGLIL